MSTLLVADLASSAFIMTCSAFFRLEDDVHAHEFIQSFPSSAEVSACLLMCNPQLELRVF